MRSACSQSTGPGTYVARTVAVRASLLFVLGFAACGFPQVVTPSGVQVREADQATTVGEAMLDVDPATAFQQLCDYTRWPTIFPDILHVVVTRQQGDDALVTMIGPNDHHDNLHFHNRPTANTVWFEDTGGRADVWLSMVFEAGPRAGTTYVKGTIFADVKGVASLVVSDARVRHMRQEKLASDLIALRNYFAKLATISRK
jgi:hypothetical protein